MASRKTGIPKNVRVGKNALIGEFVILGSPPRGCKQGERQTIIGDNAVIRSHTVIYSNVRIGNGLETGHGVVIRENCVIGDNVRIGTHSIIENDNILGNNVRIHSNVFIPQLTTIEDDAWIGPNVVFTNDPHPPCAKCMKGPTIKKGARIGAHATLLPSVVVGEYSLVGAGALVIGNVPPKSVVAGFPAKVIKKITDLKCRTGQVEKPYE